MPLTGIIVWAGCIAGAAGALLLATKCSEAKWGFVLFLASNACWLGYGLITGAYGMVVMQLAFTATSLVGIWNWILAPAIEDVS